MVQPYEPIIQVTAPLAIANFIETYVLNQLGFASLVATKAARMYYQAENGAVDPDKEPSHPILEFGLRRVQGGMEGGLIASRAAYIGGCVGTSNVLAEHSRVMRKILDENGFADAKIVVSNDLDEKIIASLKEQDARIDLYGIGTKLATADGSPSLGIVYKLAEIDGRPAIKISGNREKITDPGKKQIYRVEKGGHFAGDIMALAGEDLHGKVRTLPRMDDVEVKTLDADNAVQLLVPVFTNGELVYETPELGQIQKNALKNLQQCRPQTLRTENPAQYWVGLSPELAKVKRDLIKKYQIQK
jgi:nicotinate phosphoribosyltransferase